MKKTIILAAALGMLSLSGCATILKGDSQNINVATSNGEKIEAKVAGKSVTIPGVVSVPRKKQELYVTTKNPNCTPKTVATNTIEPVFWVNILSGGVIGSTTDYVSESMWKYDDHVVVQCK